VAASTITRDTLADDTGTPAAPVGDGTILNNAFLQNNIYARIDAMFSGVGAHTTLAVGGLFAAEGLGLHLFSGGGAGSQILRIRNTTAGTGNSAVLQVMADDTASYVELVHYSSTYTGVPDLSSLQAAGDGGLNVAAVHASGAIRFYSGGAAERLQITSTGTIITGGVAAELAHITIGGRRVFLKDNGFGTGSAAFGQGIVIGRNTDGSGAAGSITFIQRTGGVSSIWADNSASPGIMRVSTTAPNEDNSFSDTGGSVIGAQTSLRAFKDILARFGADDDAAALALIARTPIYRFKYKAGWNGQEFVGITTDESPEFGYDRSPEYPQGKAFNPVSAAGYLMAAVRALTRRVAELEAAA